MPIWKESDREIDKQLEKVKNKRFATHHNTSFRLIKLSLTNNIFN